MNIFLAQTELEAIQRDAFSSEGKSFAERTAMFLGLMEAVDAIQSHFSAEERARRMRIADQLDPRPDPWWRNFRKEALAEYERISASESAQLP
jgi:hypothetical protein